MLGAASALAVLLSPHGAAIAAGPAPLVAEFVVTKPSSKEGAKFTISLTVTNTGNATIENVRPSNVDVTGTGAAALAKWPKPATAPIRAGGRATFKLSCVATLRGTARVQAAATSDAGDSPLAVSPEIVIAPRKSGASATTTDLGDAMLRVGKAELPIRLRDERTGTPIAGLAIAFVVDKKVKSRGVVAVLDPLGRYPPQWILLSGPRSAAKASGPPVPVDFSVRGA